MPTYSAAEMRPVMNLLVSLWPNPEITAEAFTLDAQVYADADIAPKALIAAVRSMRATRTDPFRPVPAEVINASRPTLARYHRPFSETTRSLPPAPVDKAIGRTAMAEMRAAMSAARNDPPASAAVEMDEPVDGAA